MKTGIFCIGNNVFDTLLAISEDEQARGLMHIDPPAPNMAFVYQHPQINQFWMSNTKMPLDIIFCHNGKVSQICKGEPYSTQIIGDHKLSDLVIELPYGTAQNIGIKLGNKVELVKPTHEELKTIIAQNRWQIKKF